MQDQTVFSMHLVNLERDIRELMTYRDIAKAGMAGQLVHKIRTHLADAQRQAEVFNRREALFAREATEYTVIEQYFAKVRRRIFACPCEL